MPNPFACVRRRFLAYAGTAACLGAGRTFAAEGAEKADRAAGADVGQVEREKAAAERLVLLRTGDLPIVLSAPHGGREPIPGIPPRTGKGIDKFVTVRDERSDRLAEHTADRLAERLGKRPHLVVARFERKYLDVNRVAKDAFEADAARAYFDAYHDSLRTACAEIEKTWGWGLLLDIHGQASEPGAIFRGTGDGTTVKHLLGRYGRDAVVGPKSIMGLLAAQNHRVLPELSAVDLEEDRYDGGWIVRSRGSGAGGTIDAIQLEFGTELRGKERVERTADQLAAAIETYGRTYLPQKKIGERGTRE